MCCWKRVFAFRSNTQKDVLFIIGDWNVKVGSQEIPGVTGKVGLGVTGKLVLEYKTKQVKG